MFFHPIRIPLLLLISLCFNPADIIAQTQLLDSKVALEAGVAKYDKGLYKEAISEFLKIPEGDTNYATAQYELALTYLADSSYDLAIETIQQQLQTYHCSNKRNLQLLLGNSYDYTGKHDSAIAVYQRLSQNNPHDFQPIHEEGVVYMQQKNYDKAIELFQKAILHNPYHFRSHLMLGICYLKQGRMSEAFIALETSLAVTNNIEAARQSISLLDALTKQKDEVVSAYGSKEEMYKHPLFDEIDQIMNAKLSANRSYKVKSVLEEDNAIRVAYMIMDKLQYDPDDQNFVMQYYVPLFTEVFRKEMFDPFMLHIFSNFGIEIVDKYAKKQKKEISDLRQILYPYLNKILATRILNYNQRLKAKETYYYNAGESVFATGNLETVNNQSSFKAGHAQFFTNMTLAAEGDYNDKGEKHGEWKHYYPSGVVRLTESYVNGKIQGESIEYHESGHPRYYVKWNAKGEKMEEKEYTYNGQLKEHTVTDGNGIQTTTSYHSNGQPEGSVRIKDDKPVDGSYSFYHENGKPSREITVSGGKLNGVYKNYFDNGQLNETGTYKNGEKHGQVTIYFENGKTSYVLNYDNGKLEGSYEDYDNDGTLIRKGFYKKDKKHGLEQLFRDGWEYGQVEYKNGFPVAYKYVNKDGRVIDKKEGKELSMFRTYYPNGVKKSEAPVKDGSREGMVSFYFSTGILKEKSMYHNDVADGKSITYYRSGNVNSESTYEKGERTGLYKSYFVNGNPQAQGWLVNDAKAGSWKFFNANGTINEEGYYMNDVINGPNKQYRINGRLNYIDYYDRDMLIGSVHYDSSGRVTRKQSFPLGNGLYESFYENGQKAYQCEVKNGLYHGKMTKYYLTGQLLETGTMEFGKRSGEFTGYHITGVLASKGNYKNGKRNGEWKFYDEDGILAREIEYRNGEQHGIDKVYVHGRLQAIHHMEYGYREGAQTFYGDSNKVAVVLQYKNLDLAGYTYNGKDGKPVPLIPIEKGTGTVTAYYPNGQKSAEFSFSGNVPTGKQLLYFSNGQVAEERNFENSDLNGPFKRYFEEGQLHYEAFYKDDELHGEEKKFDTSGRLVEHGNYFYGVYHGVQQITDPKTGKQTSIVYHYGIPVSIQ